MLTPGATSSTFTLASAALTNNGAAFSVVLTNSYLGTNYTATSSNAVLTVIADTNPPVLVRAVSLFPGGVLVTFSEGVRADTHGEPEGDQRSGHGPGIGRRCERRAEQHAERARRHRRALGARVGAAEAGAGECGWASGRRVIRGLRAAG